ncbi:RNA polymerase factor sigma-54 [uncultured Megamonas sp.]|uniref:RNA polymerase factor sigma-54 n=1 Tax=uncultured Megamonas sp. TaxID=286140 RepID=UPI00266FA54A|nr:RNA polymerase factor sigma-54 [uncultured Megamonas sp.]
MKQSLSLNLKQKLLMTPKLQQSINILQLSAHELGELIEKEYMENPTLEMDSSSEHELEPTSDFERTMDFLEYLNKDDEKPEPMANDDDYKVKEFTRSNQTLEEYLSEQVDFTFNDKQEIKIAHYIIGLLDAAGYLRTSLAEISSLLNTDEEIIKNVLVKIQLLEPVGIGARDLPECLAIQAKKINVYNGIIKDIIDKYLTKVADGKIKEIAILENTEPIKVQEAIDIIRSFNPKPGASFGKENLEYIVPDVVVKDINGKLEVIINDTNVPKLRVNSLCYKRDMLDANSKKYIEQHVNSAIWLIKSIEQRRITLLKVVNEIVKQQEMVFYKGLSYMKPLLMKTIAENIGVHESTVSRTVANKYMEMPYGIIALKKFFAASVNKQNGEEQIIADKVKVKIKELIESENKAKPFSDQQLSNILNENGMKISRRTVMKYREQLGLASSSKRKRY